MGIGNRQDKLEELLDMEGMDEEELGSYTFMSVVPGICMNDMCDFTTSVEPDQTEGWCELCNENTVMSGLELLLF